MSLQLYEDRPVTTPLTIPSGNTQKVTAVLNGADLASLSSYEVKARLWNHGTQEFHVEQAATIENEAADEVSYQLDRYETTEPGSYGLRFVLIGPNDNETKYPGDGWYPVHISGPTKEETETTLQDAIRYGKGATDARDAILRVLSGGLAVVEEKTDELKIITFDPASARDGTITFTRTATEYTFDTVEITVDEEVGS